MTLRDLFEDFRHSPVNRSGPADEADPALEAARAAGYEAGYASGWDDALASIEKQKGRIDAEFERCIQDLGFTYHEAVTQLRQEAIDLLSALGEQFIPSILPDLFRETVREEILLMLDDVSGGRLELIVSAEAQPIFEDLLARDHRLDIALKIEPSLGPSQAYLRIGKREKVVDFQPLLDTLRNQLDAFSQTSQAEAAHG